MNELVVEVPSEITDNEKRVALTADLIHEGHQVVLPAGVGIVAEAHDLPSTDPAELLAG